MATLKHLGSKNADYGAAEQYLLFEHGRYENIFLSKDEYDELQAEYPDRLERLIEEMSHYLAASGKAYQNYAAALHRWAANDKKGAVKQGIPDYTCMEGESL